MLNDGAIASRVVSPLIISPQMDPNWWNERLKVEPVEFQKQPVGVQDFRKITNCFRGI